MATKVYSTMPAAHQAAKTAGYFSDMRSNVPTSEKFVGGKYSAFLPYFVGGRKATPDDDYDCLYGTYLFYCVLHVSCWIGVLVSDIAVFSKVNFWAPTRSLVYDLSLASLLGTSIAWLGLALATIFYCSCTLKKDRISPALYIAVASSALVASLFFSAVLFIHYSAIAPVSTGVPLTSVDHAPPPPPPSAPLVAGALPAHANQQQPITDWLFLALGFKFAILTFLKINSDKVGPEGLSMGDFDSKM